jgi:FHS family L-fucose permease-like MFS transporter
MTMIIIFIICAMTIGGNAGVATLSLVLFFESCVYPTIFTLALRGLGRHTKRGASFIVSSVSGGAVFPPVLGVVADARNTQVAMCIPLVGFIVSWSFPLYLNLFKGKELDGYLKSKVGIVEGANASVESGVGQVADGSSAGDEKRAEGVVFQTTSYNKAE